MLPIAGALVRIANPSLPSSGARERLRRSLCATHAGSALLRVQRVLAAPLEGARRRALARRLPAPTLEIDSRLGYARFEARDLPLGPEVVELAAQVYARTQGALERIHAAQRERYGIAFDLLSDDRLLAWPRFVDFALSEPLVATVARYLGTLPVLRRVSLALSRARADLAQPQGSQLFHFDREDRTQLKLYLSAGPVDAGCGALHYLSAEASARVVAALRERARGRPRAEGWLTFGDEEVLEHCEPGELQRLEGPPGSGLLLDTSRCLHFGSRMAPGRERLLVYLSYQRYHVLDPTPHNSFDRTRFRGDELRARLLRPPRECPFGWFFPNPMRVPGPTARGGLGGW